MPSVMISDKIKRNYIEYAIEVNTSRSIPLVFDGLKIVQRRLLLVGASIAHSKLVKSASLIGECMANYHPHGDASLYGALVDLVNDKFSMFTGQGNWGDYETGPAAYRYTSAKLSDFSKEYYLRYINYAPMNENELGHLENQYIPTKVPYALVNGTSGIGLGVATIVPSFTLDSILSYVNWLSSPSGISEPELKLNYNSYDMDSSVLSSGKGRIKFSCNYKFESDRSIVVTDHLPGSNIKSLLASALKTELDAKKVFIRDESGPQGLRFVVGKIWWVNMSDIELKIKNVSKTVTANMNWSTGEEKPLVKRLSPRQVLEISLEKYLKAIEDWKSDEISKVNREILFQRSKSQILQGLLSGKTWSNIQSELAISANDLSFIKNKSINQLSKDSDNSKELEKKIKEIKKVSI